MQQLAPRPTSPCANASNRTERKWVVPFLIVIAGLLTFLPTLGLTGIIDPSDGFFSESAREMFESGNFIVPRLNYEPYNNKPILTNWLICGAYQLFGVSEFSSRIPSAICAILLCVGTYLFARRFLKRRTAILSALILLSSMLFSTLARVSLTDMPLALCVNMALFSLFVGFEQKKKAFMTFGYIALGLSFLTKGPIAFLIVGGTFLLYFLAISKSFRPKPLIEKFQKLDPLKALLYAAAINLPWFVAVGLATKGAFITDFFFTENVMRAMGKIQMNHAQAPYYYLPILAAGFFPWTLLILGAVPAITKWWQHRLSSTARVRLIFFCCAAAVTVFGGFSILKGKLPTYILPMFPSLAILTASGLDAMAGIRTRPRLLWTGITLIAASIVALVMIQFKVHLGARNHMYAMMLAAGCLVAFSGFTITLAVKRARVALLQVGISWAIVSALLVPFLFQVFYNHHQRCYADLLQEAKSSGKEVFEIVTESPSAPFYLQKHVPSIQNYFDFAYLLAKSPEEKLILCWDKYEQLPNQAPYHRLVDRKQQYCLYAVADPDRQLLTTYIAKLLHAEVAYMNDKREPDPKLIVTSPSRGIQ